MFSKDSASSFVTTGYKLNNPNTATYHISSTIAHHTGTVNTYAKAWNICDEINLNWSNTNYDIYYYGEYTIDNGTYGTANVQTNVITFYKAFIDTSSAYRNEVIVYETGHCLGIDHCQNYNCNISVMRATGFNNKAFPLADDITGI